MTPSQRRTEERAPRALRLGLVAGGALAVAIAWLATSRESFFLAYLFGYLFWFGLALGSLALRLLQRLAGGGWGLAIDAVTLAATRTIGVLLLLSLPLWVGLAFELHDLYPWRAGVLAGAHGAHGADSAKAGYFALPFFLGRTALYFILWLVFSRLVRPARRGAAARAGPSRGGVAAAGLAVYVLTVSFAAIDWVMSLEPEWYSSIFGALFVVGNALTALAFAVLILCLERRPHAGESDGGAAQRVHDLGNLLLAFVLLWAYLSFSQYLIIWSGNLPAEMTWYLRRTGGGWEWIAAALLVFHFALPLLVLLSRRAKKRGAVLGGVAAGILCLRMAELFWIVVPARREGGLAFSVADFLVPLALGAVWLTAFLRQLDQGAAAEAPAEGARQDASIEIGGAPLRGEAPS